MTYGGYNFSPVPIVDLQKIYERTADGTMIGSAFNYTLNGEIYTPTGGLSSIVASQNAIRSAFASDGQLFQVKCDGNVLFQAYPRIIAAPEFRPSPDNWVLTCPYNIGLQFDDEPQPTGTANVSLGENSSIMPPFISDFSESWQVEFVEDQAHFSETLTGAVADANLYQMRLTHNITAVGKRRYTGLGLDMPAWQQARAYVVPKLGYNGSFAVSSGVLNIGSGFSPFNHVRTNVEDVAGGSFSVVETWFLINSTGIGVAGNAIEDFTVDIRKGIESDISTLSIQGTIQGLETRTYGTNPGDFAITTTKYAAASGYWNTIKDTTRVLPRVQLYATTAGLTRNVNVTPVNKIVGHNPTAGLINYAYEYNDRPSTCIAGALTESINITDNNATDVFAELAIPGRALGPVLQGMGTITSSKREVSVDCIVAPSTGCTTTLLFATNPKSSVATLINLFYSDLAAANTQIYKYLDTESWQPKEGHYSRQVAWVYQSGCSF